MRCLMRCLMPRLIMVVAVLAMPWGERLHAQPLPVSESVVVSETAPRDVVNPANMREGVLRLLDKQTNAVQALPMVLENALKPAPDVQLTLRKCVRDYKGMRGLDVAWVDVELPNSEGYKGWIFNWYPDAAGPENPRYDVRLIQCGAPDDKRRLTPATVGGVVVQGVEARGGDEEAPDAAPQDMPSEAGEAASTVGGPAEVNQGAAAAPVEAPAEEAPAEVRNNDNGVAPAAQPEPTPAAQEPSPVAEQGGDDPFFVPGVEDQKQLRQMMDGQ